MVIFFFFVFVCSSFSVALTQQQWFNKLVMNSQTNRFYRWISEMENAFVSVNKFSIYLIINLFKRGRTHLTYWIMCLSAENFCITHKSLHHALEINLSKKDIARLCSWELLLPFFFFLVRWSNDISNSISITTTNSKRCIWISWLLDTLVSLKIVRFHSRNVIVHLAKMVIIFKQLSPATF